MTRDIPKTVDDWAKRVSESGITGSLTMVGDNPEGREIKQVEIGGAVVGNFRTKIPGELIGHLHEILRERDRMVAEALKVSIEIPNEELNKLHMASLRASCLQIAIDIIRKKYEDTHGTTAESDDTGERNGDAAGAEATGTPAEATSDS